MAATSTARIDPTYRAFCSTHGANSPQTYLGRERYSCWHCNKYDTPEPTPAQPLGPEIEAQEIGDIPDWMLDSCLNAGGDPVLPR